MAISQQQANVAQAQQAYAAPQRGAAAAWAGDIAAQILVAEATFFFVPSVPALPTVGTALSSLPLLPAGLPGLAGLPKNALVTSTPVTVRGLPFGNRPLADYKSLWGATVAAASGDNKVYVIDLHGLRTIRNVTVTGGGSLKVRPWEGVRFADQATDLTAGKVLELLTQKIEVTLTTALTLDQFEAQTSVECACYPSNVRFVIAQKPPADNPPTAPALRGADGKLLALAPAPFAQATGKEPIFWTYNGDLSGEVTLPDFSQALNDFLESAPAQAGLCFPHLIAYADTPGFLELQETGGSPLVQLNYLTTVEFGGENPLTTTVSFRHHGDAQTVDLTLFPQRAGQRLVPAGVDAAAPQVRVHKLTLELSGTLDPDRLDPDVYWTARDVPAQARVSSVFSLAQPILPQTERQVSGVDLYLSATAGADLALELQTDQGGTPSGQALTAAAVDVGAVTEQPGWVAVKFAEPVMLPGQQRAWIVLKARGGQAFWLADAGESPNGPVGPGARLHFSRDGAFWTTHEPPLSGLHKLKIVLPAGERPPALKAALLNRTSIVLQPTTAPQKAVVLFDDPGANLQGSAIALTLTPEAAGQATLASVVVEYVPAATP